MADSQGFWSCVHADDEAEGGRIVRLARDVAAQFRMMTGCALVRPGMQARDDHV